MKEKNKKRIKLYAYDIKDLKGLNLSPFELLDTLQIRDQLSKEYHRLNQKDKEIIKECDKILLENVKLFYQHLNSIYDWDPNEPLFRWWWHLDKVVNGKLKVNLDKMEIEYEDENIHEYFINHHFEIIYHFEESYIQQEIPHTISKYFNEIDDYNYAISTSFSYNGSQTSSCRSSYKISNSNLAGKAAS